MVLWGMGKPHRVNLSLDEKTYDQLRQSAFDRRMQPTALAAEIVRQWVEKDGVTKDGVALQSVAHPINKTGNRLRIDYKNACEEVEL